MAEAMEKIMGNNDEEMRMMQECECTMNGLKLKEDVRKIWDDHVFWTREVVLTAAVGDAGGGCSQADEEPGGHWGQYRAVLR